MKKVTYDDVIERIDEATNTEIGEEIAEGSIIAILFSALAIAIATLL